jgi:hypothetical protein
MGNGLQRHRRRESTMVNPVGTNAMRDALPGLARHSMGLTGGHWREMKHNTTNDTLAHDASSSER